MYMYIDDIGQWAWKMYWALQSLTEVQQSENTKLYILSDIVHYNLSEIAPKQPISTLDPAMC